MFYQFYNNKLYASLIIVKLVKHHAFGFKSLSKQQNIQTPGHFL